VKLALKIDVDTLQGTQRGVPVLLEMLARHQAAATFLFSLGPDRTGLAIRRVFRPGFLSKVSRTSVLQHYGLRTLLYGTLLPAPDIGRRCAPLHQPRLAQHDHARPQVRINRRGRSAELRDHGSTGADQPILVVRQARRAGVRAERSDAPHALAPQHTGGA
jgi:hypothetical protein